MPITTRGKAKATQMPWFARAGAASSIVPISRFVGTSVFALKAGGYGCLFSLEGIDEEGLTDQELESRVRGIEAALRGLPERSCLYQYARVLSGCELPRLKRYPSAATEAFISDRLSHLEKTAAFRRVDLLWGLTMEPGKGRGFERTPMEDAGESSRMLAELQKTTAILTTNLGSSLGLKLLDDADVFQFFSYLFNLEEWSAADRLRQDTGVDRQIVKSTVQWRDDHLRVGKRYVQMFSLYSG